jgi:hypothetical protein
VIASAARWGLFLGCLLVLYYIVVFDPESPALAPGAVAPVKGMESSRWLRAEENARESSLCWRGGSDGPMR